MNSVNKTLYIPLYGKSYVSKKGLFIDDKKAEEIWEAEGFSLKGKSKSKWLAYYMGVRSAVFDEWLKQQMATAPDAVVIHIGCGMDSRIIRTGSKNHKWYDVDFLEVIKERKLAEAINSIKNKYGKNSILKVMNLDSDATTVKRNKLIGGHNAENEDAD